MCLAAIFDFDEGKNGFFKCKHRSNPRGEEMGQDAGRWPDCAGNICGIGH